MARLLCMIALMAVAAWGQLPRRDFGAWWDSPVARDLNLRDDQQQQIRSTVREYRRRLIDLRADVQRAEVELDEAFNADTVDARRANDAIDRLASARAELTKTLSQMSLRLRMVLSPEQWRELQRRGTRLGPTRRARPQGAE